MIGMAAYNWVVSRPWAIEQSMLDTIIEISMREGEGAEAVAAKLGRPLDNTRTVMVRDGVAIIPVHGVISQRASMFSQISGGCSTDVIATDLQRAMDDPTIRAIMIDADSPGGQVAGVGQLGDMIYGCRGKKRIETYVSGQMCSAMAWLGTSAEKVHVSPHSQGGSIGAVLQRRDTSVRDSRSGVSTEEYVSRQSPKKRPDTSTEGGRSVIQAEVDKIGDLFVNAVARNRGTTCDDIEENYGQGATMFGDDMINCGMADCLGSYESVLADLAATKPRSVFDMNRAGLAATSKGAIIVADELNAGVADNPAYAQALADLAVERAKTAKLFTENLDIKAQAFVSALVGTKIDSVESASIKDFYSICAQVDAGIPLPAGTSLVASYNATFANRRALKTNGKEQISEGTELETVLAGRTVLDTGGAAATTAKLVLPGASAGEKEQSPEEVAASVKKILEGNPSTRHMAASVKV